MRRYLDSDSFNLYDARLRDYVTLLNLDSFKPEIKEKNFCIIDISNVMYVHKGKATRIGFKFENDKKVRFAKSTGEVID